jgi:hypothetical protein|tara:strand:- start:14602 stop:15663 length:1062 start_codon:yes stop_codon:yes gene_type:complete
MSQAAHYSPQEFRFGFLPEETIGTALVPASGKTLQLINVDSISAPSLNTEIVSDVKTGAGRTAKTADLYVNSTLMKREISFSGTADYNSLPELLSAVMGVAEASTDLFKILVGHTPLFDMKTDVQRTDSSTAATYASAWAAAGASNAGTHTVYIWSPVASNSMQFKGCVLQSLTVSADMGSESGRFKVEGSWVTGYNADLTVAAPNSSYVTAYSSNNYYLTDIDTHTIAGVSDPVMQSFSMTVENPTEYLGFVGTSEIKPEVISRSIPEISANWESTFKYDTDSAALFETYEAGTNVALTTSDSNNSKIGFTSANNVITSVGFAENAAQYVTVGAKVLAGASGSMLEIVAKDA